MVCRVTGASHFGASMTKVTFPGLVPVTFLNFFCIIHWDTMRKQKSLCPPRYVHQKAWSFLSEVPSFNKTWQKGLEVRSN